MTWSLRWSIRCKEPESSTTPLLSIHPTTASCSASTGASANRYLDVVATIVELAGASPGTTLDGHSLGPLFADSNAPWRSAIAFESPSAHFMGPAERYTGVRTATRKYIKFDTGVEMLYDLAADPHESNSRTGNAAYAGDLALLRGLKRKAQVLHWRNLLAAVNIGVTRQLVLPRSRHK